MSTERKEGVNTATQNQERFQTGKEARDEQTKATLHGGKPLNERWHETKAELKKKFQALTEEDLELKPGGEQETIDRIGKRLKKSHQEAEQLVRDTAKRFQENAAAQATDANTGKGIH